MTVSGSHYNHWNEATMHAQRRLEQMHYEIIRKQNAENVITNSVFSGNASKPKEELNLNLLLLED